MAESVVKWDKTTAAARMRKRRRWRMVFAGVVGLVLLSILADHLRAKNRGDDWERFDGRAVQFVGAVDGCTIAVRDRSSDDTTVVGLLGIKRARGKWDQKSADRLLHLLRGNEVILHLRTTAPRDSGGRLMADVFTDDRELVAADLAGEGLVVADWRDKGDFYTDIAREQSTARRKRLGLWGAEAGD